MKNIRRVLRVVHNRLPEAEEVFRCRKIFLIFYRNLPIFPSIEEYPTSKRDIGAVSCGRLVPFGQSGKLK